jgi:type II secretory pathway pseudopilin PulG
VPRQQGQFALYSLALKTNSNTSTGKNQRRHRTASGFQLMEMMVATVIGTFLLTSVYGTASTMYRAISSGQNQMFASNMAQQVMDNARNSTYGYLRDTLLGGAGVGSATQQLSLYSYPTANPAFFPRPLLQNRADTGVFSYSPRAQGSQFKGTVTETLVNLTPNKTTNGQIQVFVSVAWVDSQGPHLHKTSTIISQSGIHN